MKLCCQEHRGCVVQNTELCCQRPPSIETAEADTAGLSLRFGRLASVFAYRVLEDRL